MKRTFLITFLIAASLGMSGCDTLFRKKDPTPVPPTGKLNIDRALLEPCKEFPLLKSGEEKDVVEMIGEAKIVLKECSSNHQGLINAIKSVK